VIGIAQDSTSLKYELVDLVDWPLLMNDEPDIPAHGIYTQEHTRAWSAQIASADAIIFVVLSQFCNWLNPVERTEQAYAANE
jgi:NAD(P)H-dependent FMN reductase